MGQIILYIMNYYVSLIISNLFGTGLKNKNQVIEEEIFL